jgi:hypothetical protein
MPASPWKRAWTSRRRHQRANAGSAELRVHGTRSSEMAPGPRVMIVNKMAIQRMWSG